MYSTSQVWNNAVLNLLHNLNTISNDSQPRQTRPAEILRPERPGMNFSTADSDTSSIRLQRMLVKLIRLKQITDGSV